MPTDAEAIYSFPERGELDELCCPINQVNRTKALGIVWNQDSRLRRVAYLYQTKTYKQHLYEIECRFSNQTGENEVEDGYSRCEGRCEQRHGSQLMITLWPSPLKFSLTNIEVKAGCQFISINDEDYK